MNILVFTAIYPSPEEFGIPADTKAIHYFAKEWKTQGHHVEVFYLYTRPIKKLRPQSCNQIFKSKIGRYVFEGVSVSLFERQLVKPHANRLLPFQMKEFQKEFEDWALQMRDSGFIPDLVTMHFPMSFYGLDLSAIKTALKTATFHMCDILDGNTCAKSEIIKYLTQFRNICSRNNLIRKVLNKDYGINSNVVYSGISDTLIADEHELKTWKCDKKDRMNIVYAGRLIPLKKVDVLIKAVKDLEFDYHVSIIGDGSEAENLKRLAEQLGISKRISFLGRMSREDTVSAMRKANVFVMVSKPETFGLVYLEAMAQGCIVIGSKGQGIDGVIDNGVNGFLVEPDDVHALSKTINKIYDLESNEYNGIAAKGHETAMHMTDSKMAKQYLSMMQNTNER